VIEFSEQFISIKINAGEEPGKEIAERYNINGVPQMVFVNNNEDEIDRIIGYRKPNDFIVQVQDILDGNNTLPDLTDRLANDPDNNDLLSALAGKYVEMGNDNGATELYEKLLVNSPGNVSEEINGARYYLAMKKFYEGDKAPIESFIKAYPSSEYVYEAYSKVSRFYASEKDMENEVIVLTEWSNKYPDDYSALNAFAWRMTELETQLEEALVKVRHAVSLLDDKPDTQANIIDTEAEVLWKLGRIDEAVEAIDKAIEISPDYQYFQDQKTKFLESAS
jgi:tetratricopeptide (TPR) repeat protein